MKSLRQANSSCLLNNFDMVTLSMPLEYSVVNNYWFVQSVKHHLRLLEKRAKFLQIQALKSCVLFSARHTEIPKPMKVPDESVEKQTLSHV